MTVNYVCRVQKDVTRQMSLGFASCMHEVDAFLAQTGTGSEVDTQLRAHLVRRLSRCRRHVSSAVLADRTGSRRRNEDQPLSSSSTSTSGCGLLPRRLFVDDTVRARSARGPVLGDINDNARYSELASGDIYRRSTTLSTGNENMDLACVQQLDTTAVGADCISSTTVTSAQGPSRHNLPSGADVENSAAALDYTNKWNVAEVKDEPLTPVWRPW